MIRQPDDPGPVVRRRTHRSRALDWACAAAILSWGLMLALPGDTLASSPAYRLLVERFPEPVWAMLLIAIGLARAGALIVNGRRPAGSPMVRGGAAFLGVLVWSQFFAALLDQSLRLGAPADGVGLYLVLLGADVFSAARAAYDALVGIQSGRAHAGRRGR